MTKPDLSGKTALVTGASRGIGRAFALALAEAGAHIIALSRTVGGLEELDDEIRAIGGQASLLPVDVTDKESISALGPTLSTRFKSLDIVIFNAAILGELAALRDLSEQNFQGVIDTNLTANWRLLAGLDPLIEASVHGARLVFLTSRVGGELARPFWGPYAISKAGLEMMARTYAEESHHLGTRVAIIDPGATRTDMRAQAMPGEDPSTLQTPDALTPLLYKAVAPDYDGMAERLIMRDLAKSPIQKAR